MNRKTRKSSRIRMKGRRKGSKSQSPTSPIFNESGKLVNPFFNRARRRHDAAWMRHAPGRTVREKMNQHRKALQTAVRRQLRVLRKELKQVLRARS